MFALYFSGFSAHALEIDGVIYPTLEHAYHCLRFSDAAIAEEIRAARSPEKAWELSQRHKANRTVLSDKEKIELMTMLTRAKIQQHPDVRHALIASEDQTIVKRIVSGPPGDGFWDIADGSGRNEWGMIWMTLRKELRERLL